MSSLFSQNSQPTNYTNHTLTDLSSKRSPLMTNGYSTPLQQKVATALETIEEMSLQTSITEATDAQKILFTQFSYLPLDFDKVQRKLSQGTVTVRSLVTMLKNPEEVYLGSAAGMATGLQVTPQEILRNMIQNGFGDMQVLGVEADEKSGFNAMALKDDNDNIILLYRGTDISTPTSFVKDSLTDVTEFLTEDDEQVQKAEQFYEQYAANSNKVYLFGHSLGGNLTEHVYADHFEHIKDAFVIDPFPISQRQLDTEEKVAAFNNADKFHCYVVGGDWVSELRDTNLYEQNIRYIKNNNSLKDHIMSDHALEMATCKEDGSFELVTKEEAYQNHQHSFSRETIQQVATTGDTIHDFLLK